MDEYGSSASGRHAFWSTTVVYVQSSAVACFAEGIRVVVVVVVVFCFFVFFVSASSTPDLFCSFCVKLITFMMLLSWFRHVLLTETPLQVHRCIRKDTEEEYAVKVIDKTSLSSHEKFLLRGEIGAWCFECCTR